MKFLKKNKQQHESLEEKEIKTLLQVHKGLILRHKKLKDHKQPVLLLMRRGNKIDIYENVKADVYDFTHSNGEEVSLYLNKRYLHSLPYGDRTTQVYIAHEDDAFPYPKDPLFEITQIKIATEKLMNDIKTWKAKEILAGNQRILYIIIGIALIMLVIMLYGPDLLRTWLTNQPVDTVQTAVNTSVTVLS